ncbi:alpha-2-antiplasmin [Pelobates cultripes]|uniref:Alpha-2-antiplasmin n=1 Tax=Pelobates cultripes TaxID=61616 RepID=A0AAD1R094_PELCU|nr:alpha-2-antiplasmin [Pelobates cultripes]
MDKSLLICLLLFPGICLSSFEADVEEEPLFTTTAPTTPFMCNTKPGDSGVLDSTSDSWSDIHPWHTTTVPTTTTTTESTAQEEKDDEDTETVEEKSDEAEDLNDLENQDNECTQDATPEDIQKFSQAVMDFSVDLLKQTDPEFKKPHVIISPFSVALGLLQLSLGAGEETEKRLLETLHLKSVKCLHSQLRRTQHELTSSIMKIASRMYIKKGFKIKKDFMKRAEKWYGSKTLNLAKNKEQNLESINEWVRKATEGMIPKFLSEIPADMVLMLLNAMYFKGIWHNKFDPSMTVQDTFHINDELTVPVDMMTAQKFPLRWYNHELLDSQVAKLPFKGNMSFVVVTPFQFKWNISKLLDNFNQSDIYHRFPRPKQTLFRMPKLNLDFKLELTQALSNLGLGQLFSKPDLSGISDEPLYVSSVQHQSNLVLNEEGAQAAAATAVITSRSLASYSINRPFLFFLFDDATRLPLFLGYVRNPSPDSYYKKKELNFQSNPDKGSIPK